MLRHLIFFIHITLYLRLCKNYGIIEYKGNI
nr:MAG TPA: hypothetical protein [Caudoviricetes sp.]